VPAAIVTQVTIQKRGTGIHAVARIPVIAGGSGSVLDFRFKAPRLLTVDIPGRGRKICWYMWYQVVNRTGEDQNRLLFYAVAREGGRIVAAGRGAIEHLKPGTKKLFYNVYFVGDPTGAEVELSYYPTLEVPGAAESIIRPMMESPPTVSPPASAVIGGRLLPSAVLEITPGFASQLVARCWGFSGPSLCLVGDVDRDIYGLKNSLNESGLKVFQVNLRGSGDNRVIEWNV